MRIKIFIIAALACFATSCKDSLDEKVYGTIPEISTPAELNAATIGVYQAMDSNLGLQRSLFPMAEVGHRYSSYGSTNENFGNRDFYRYIFTDRNPEFNTVWTNYYRMINRANDIIEIAPKVVKDTTIANSYIAEAKFLRAWSYFTLTQFFGPVPLHVKPTTSIGDFSSLNLPRSPVQEVYALIVDDLKYASQEFPGLKTRLPLARPSTDLGRVTVASALGMLGKVYLTMAGIPLNDPNGYTNAAQVLEKLVVGKGRYNTDLLLSYSRVFATTNEMNSEILFALRAFANTSNITSGADFPTSLAPIHSNVDASIAITPMYGIRADIVDLYNANDIRLRDAIGFIYSDMRSTTAGIRDSIIYNRSTRRYNRYIPTAPNIFGVNITPATGYGLGYTKWRAEIPRIAGSARSYNNDWIILRFSDVLLSYAESLNELGRPNDAIPIINQVRARARAIPVILGTNQIVLKQIIREERKRELLGEFTTVFDMRRWGTVKEEIDNYQSTQFDPRFISIFPVYNSKFELYPVPYAQIAINPKLLPQNPGW